MNLGAACPAAPPGETQSPATAGQAPTLSGEHIMRTKFGLAASAALIALLAWSPAVVAQQKTVRQCRDEWNANKTALSASGKTQRVFVAECRGVSLVPTIS